MIPIILLLIIATIAAAALVFAPRLEAKRLICSDQPDRPCSFGPDMAWLAIKTQDSAAVIAAIGLVEPMPSNWNSGLGTVYDPEHGQCRLFVTSPVDGYVFVVGSCLPHPHGPAFVDKCLPLLEELAGRFPDVQYFASFSEIDLFAWARFLQGRAPRAFGVSDEGVIWVRGRATREEKLLGLKLFELRGVRGRRGDAGGELLMHPTQEHVMRLAGQWSVNPTLIDGLAKSAALGAIGFAPAVWAAQRQRKSA